MNQEKIEAGRGTRMENGIGIRHGKAGIVFFFLLTIAMFVGSDLFTTDSHAFQRYNDGCDLCHGTFISNVSPKGTNFGTAGNKHEMHRSSSFMGTACNLCHTSGDGRDPYLGTSDGLTGIPGAGCAGCHNGPGLRQHHRVTGASSCSGCHASTEVAPAESAKPPYYGTSGTKANNACNLVAQANLNENWSVGSPYEGLDNDGNNLYDSADPACASTPPKTMYRTDFDGDSKTDIAIWRPTTGEWWIRRSSDSAVVSIALGSSTDIPVPGDYDGDGKTDEAIWRASTGQWWIRRSSDSAVVSIALGSSTDIPVPGDYDGDGKTDEAIWRASAGQWWIRRSSDSAVVSIALGSSTDIPVPGDYDGDGKTDEAIWRASAGQWWIRRSSDSAVVSSPWGSASDVPVKSRY
jgi:hypothetical protein